MGLIQLNLTLEIWDWSYNFSGGTLLCALAIFSKYEKFYNDPLSQRSLIRIENIHQIGVYCWFNNINQNCYVGSGDTLYSRISYYYQNWYLLKRSNLYIVRAISKYGLENFSLYILEYTDSENLISCEQRWIDLLKPEYNLNPTAGSSKGYKHTEESLSKIKNRIISKETKENMRQSAKERLYREGKKGPFENKKHTEESLALLRAIAQNRESHPVPGLKVQVTDLETDITTIYNSIRAAVAALNSDIKTILRREKNQITKPYRGRYIIKILRN